MPERKKIGILSLNVKKLISLHLLWNTIWKLQWGSLLFITWLILVQIWSESLPKYGSTIIKSFLGTVLKQLSALILCLKIFYTFVNKVTWVTISIQDTFQYIYFMTEFHKIRTQIEASEQQWFNKTGFVGFRYEGVEISINTTEGLFLINISDKFSFFTKNINV